MSPELAHRVGSLRRIDEDIADIRRSLAARRSDANDPNRPYTGPNSRSAAVSTEVCYPFGRKHRRHRAVKRRKFITLVGGAAALSLLRPRAAFAQQPKAPRIGAL